MKQEKEQSMELVEPDQEAGSSRIARRTLSHETCTTRKERHMQRTSNIALKSPGGTRSDFPPCPGKGKRHDKQKDTRRYRKNECEYDEYEDWRDEDEYTRGNDEDENDHMREGVPA